MDQQPEKMERPFKYIGEPESSIPMVFQVTDLDSLLDELDAWLPIGLVSMDGLYDEAEDREQLATFVKDFMGLIELMSEERFFENKPTLSFCKDFATKYSLYYIRMELVDFFTTVACYNGPLEIDKRSIGEYYLFFITLAEAPHWMKYQK
jgi:hypothetical protein